MKFSQTSLVLIFAAGMIGITINDAWVKYLDGAIPFGEFVFIRSLFGLVGLACIPMVWRELAGLPARSYGLLFVRGLLLMGTVTCYFSAISLLPLAEAVALFFISPFLISLMGRFLLGEPLTVYRIVAIICGFIGTLFIVWPSDQAIELGSNLGVLMGVLSAFLYASFQISTRWMKDVAGTWAMAGTMGFIYMLYGASFFLIYLVAPGLNQGDEFTQYLFGAWVGLTGEQIWILVMCGFYSLFLTVVGPMAYRNVDATVLAPFEYVSLVAGVVLGFFWFKEIPETLSFIGIALILFGGLLMVYRTNKREQAIASG